MAVLTWRNVDAPQGRASESIQGLSTAANLLSNAGNGLSNALGQFGQSQTQLADNAAAQAASRFQDPDALKAALANGSLLGSLQGVDPSRVSAATIAGLDNRVGTLLANATNQQALDTSKYNQNRTVGLNAATDAASPAIASLVQAAASGDKNATISALADPRIAALQPAAILAAGDNGQRLLQGDSSLTGSNLGNVGRGISNVQSAFNLAMGQRNDADSQSAQAVVADLAHAGDATEALKQLNTKYPNLSPGALTLVRQGLQPLYGDVFAPIGSAAAAPGAGGAIPGRTASGAIASAATSGLGGAPDIGAGLAGTPGTQNGGTYNVTYGYTKTDQPVSTMSIGDLTKDGGVQDTLQKTQGNSPIGAYQVNRGTLQDFAKKLNLPDNTVFTPEVQDQLGQAIFNDRKGGNLADTWSSLKNVPGASTPGFFKDKSWGDVRGLIQQQEGTAQASNGQDLKNNVVSLAQGLNTITGLQQARIDSNRASGVEKAIAAGAGSTTDATAEAGKLIASNPAFKGADLGQTIAKINQVSQAAGINPAAASQLISQNLQNKHGKIYTALTNAVHNYGFDSDRTTFGDTLPSGASIDDDAITAAIKGAANGKGVLQKDQTDRLVQQNQLVQGAAQQLQTAAAQLTQARQRALVDPSFTGLAKYQQQYDAAVAQARLLQATGANNAQVNFPQGFKPPG